MSHLYYLVVLPLIGAVLALVFGRWRRTNILMASLVLGAMVVSVIRIGLDILDQGIVTESVGGWPLGMGLGMALDLLGLVMIAVVIGLSVISFIYFFGKLESDERQSKFYSLVFFLTAGLMGMTLVTDVFNLFVFLELSSVSTCVLVSFNGGMEDLEAALRYIVLGTITSFVFLGGIVLVYDQVGSLNMGSIGVFMRNGNGNIMTDVSVVMMAIGLGFPAAIFPLHTWLPDAFSRAPSASTALLAGASKQVCFYAIVRLFNQTIGLNSVSILRLIPWIGLMTALFGALMALVQVDIKRLLGYTTVASGGFALALAGIGTARGFQGLVLHMINSAPAKAVLFLSAGCLIYGLSVRDYRDMKGAWSTMPGVCSAFLVGCLADLGGPSLGFFSKAYMMFAFLETSPLMGLVGGLSTILIAASYIKVIQAMVSSPDNGEGSKSVPSPMMIAIGTLVASIILLTLLFWPLISFAENTSIQIIDTVRLIEAMVGI